MVIDGVVSPIRIVETFLGKPIDMAHAGMPFGMAGFSKAPQVGSLFRTYKNKKKRRPRQGVLKTSPHRLCGRKLSERKK